MRRLTVTLLATFTAVAVALACGAPDRAEAGPAPAREPTPGAAAQPSGTPLFREASQTTPLPDASVPGQTSLAPLIEKLKPSVVNISTTTVQKNPHRGMRGPGGEPFDDFFERYFGRQMPDQQDELRGRGLGSGFLLSADGYILTNNHVVENATDIKVRLSDDRVLSAKVVGRDPATDVALIQLTSPPKNLPSVVLGDSDALRQGDFVLALGSPFGLLETATLGIVSAKNRAGIGPGGGAGTYDDFIQTDAAINPGNSGGPLFNLRGEVVGINTAIVSPQIGSGIGFAVPINIAKQLLPQLREKGKVTRGYMGVSIQNLDESLAEAFGLSASTKGALVQQIVPRSPAAKGGIEVGDVVVALNGKPVTSAGELTRGVALVPPGQKVTLTVLRKGQKKDVSFAVGTRPDEEKVARGDLEETPEDGGKSPKLGVSLAPLTPDMARQLGIQGDQGVVVQNVLPGGPAEDAGVQRGDVILSVNQQPVSQPDQVGAIIAKLKEGDKALLRVRRGNGAFFLAVTIGGGAPAKK
jgi:serine protease Do